MEFGWSAVVVVPIALVSSAFLWFIFKRREFILNVSRTRMRRICAASGVIVGGEAFGKIPASALIHTEHTELSRLRLEALFKGQRSLLGADGISFLEVLELDEEVCKERKCLEGVRMVSLGSYLSTLDPPPRMDLDAFVAAALAKAGYISVAPIIMALLPPSWLHLRQAPSVTAGATSAANAAISNAVSSITPRAKPRKTLTTAQRVMHSVILGMSPLVVAALLRTGFRVEAQRSATVAQQAAAEAEAERLRKKAPGPVEKLKRSASSLFSPAHRAAFLSRNSHSDDGSGGPKTAPGRSSSSTVPSFSLTNSASPVASKSKGGGGDIPPLAVGESPTAPAPAPPTPATEIPADAAAAAAAAGAAAAAALPNRFSSLALLKHGELAPPDWLALPELPNPFILSRDFWVYAEKCLTSGGVEQKKRMEEEAKKPQRSSSSSSLNNKTASSAPHPPPSNPGFKPILRELVPGLYWGTRAETSAPLRRAELDVGASRLLAVILNRLSYNSVPLRWREDTASTTGLPPSRSPVPDPSSAKRKTFLGADEEDDEEVYFAIKLDEDGALIHSPVDFLEALSHHGHNRFCDSLRVGITSRVTSFGMSMTVVEADGSEANVPLALPIRTGIRDPRPDCDEELVAVAPHASLSVCFQLYPPGYVHEEKKKGEGEEEKPTRGRKKTSKAAAAADNDEDKENNNKQPSQHLADVRVEWYHGVEGFCGWFIAPDGVLSWQQASEMEQWHRGEWKADKRRLAIRTATVCSVALCALADHQHLPFGGYAYAGACVDSVALVQYAIDGSTSLFPLTFGGDVRTDLIKELRALQRAMRAFAVEKATRTHMQTRQAAKRSLANEFQVKKPTTTKKAGGDLSPIHSIPDKEAELQAIEILVGATARMPSDTVIDPQNVPNACERILQTLPAVCPLKGVQQCLQRSREIIDEMNLLLQTTGGGVGTIDK